MATRNFLFKLVPEVNFWVNRTLYHNFFNKDSISCPTKISDFWRSKDSVVELIFNETADPSGQTYDDGYHFIWKYRTINLKRLPPIEPMLFRRIQVYYNSIWVYAAKDDPKFNEIFNLVDPSITVDNDYEYPYGIKPTSYLNYNSHIVTGGTDQLHYDDPPFPPPDPGPEPVIYPADENVFGLTEEELDMCEYLYYYRTGQYELIEPFDKDYYYKLQSPLSIWVANYLMCYLFDYVNFKYLKTITTKEDGYYRCLCERHFQYRIYEYLQKHNLTLWDNVLDFGIKDKRTFKNYTLENDIKFQKSRVDDSILESKCIHLDDIDKQVSQTDNFEFIYDGLVLKNGVDYSIKNIGKESKQNTVICLTNNKNFENGIKYQFMYSYTKKKNPICGIKRFDDNE